MDRNDITMKLNSVAGLYFFGNLCFLSKFVIESIGPLQTSPLFQMAVIFPSGHFEEKQTKKQKQNKTKQKQKQKQNSKQNTKNKNINNNNNKHKHKNKKQKNKTNKKKTASSLAQGE